MNNNYSYYENLATFSSMTIPQAIWKTDKVLSAYYKPLVAISGGADSDIMLDMIDKAGQKDKCCFYFFDTGLEWEATKRHIEYLKDKYNVEITRRRPKKPIPIAVKEYGAPFMSKIAAVYIGRLQKHNFDFVNSFDKTFEELYKQYPNCKQALKFYCGTYDKITQYDIRSYKYLKEFLRDNPPQFNISAMCCQKTKKEIGEQVMKELDCDIMVTGLRRAEGGGKTKNSKLSVYYT